MVKLPELSRLTPVPVRDVWAHEAHHFTQWLLENADVLAEVLGMDVELEEAEHRVGGFALDLIGTDVQTGGTVIIENQLETTDHGHLGQLLTYAGGTDPTTVVWCAPTFRDEHRAALDWLNEHTIEGIRFFGIEVAAVKIDDSAPAPMFRLVAKPNDWTKRLHTDARLTPRAAANESFWSLVLERIRQEHPSWTSAKTGSRDNWMTLPFGSSTVWYSFVLGKDNPRVELYFGSADAEANTAAFEKFLVQKERLEQGFGGPLDFQPMPGRKACRIVALRPTGFDVLNQDDHAAMVDWFVTTMERFRPATQDLRHLLL